MRVLVLDTIHGGKEIGAAYAGQGHTVDVVDVYTGTTPAVSGAARSASYDLVVSPVHLDPDHPLLAARRVPVITHHEAVRQLLGNNRPHPMIEITGSRGKTTTAHALAHILSGNGVLHTSAGTFVYPEKTLLWKRSITPASVIPSAGAAFRMAGWLVTEVSLGVTGAGDLAILTSAEDYPIAAGKKHARAAKIASLGQAERVLVAQDVPVSGRNVVHVEDIARVRGSRCTFSWEGMEYTAENPLFSLPSYQVPLMLAGAAAMLLHTSPSPLSSFTALPGRMNVSRERNLVIVDNANSGTNAATTICAAQYARSCSPDGDLTLVIGQAAGDGAVCEGFSCDQITRAIREIRPAHVVWVGRYPEMDSRAGDEVGNPIDAVCSSLEEARQVALQIAGKGSIVLSVKTWR